MAEEPDPFSPSSCEDPAANLRRPAKRQRYTLIACNNCKRRKIKCSGEAPCRQCAKQDELNCVYERKNNQDGTLLDLQNPLDSVDRFPALVSTPRHPLSPLSKAQTFELLESFREDVEILYPFIDLQEMRRLIDRLYDCNEQQDRHRRDSQTNTWDDLDDGRNIGFLKLLVACALASKRTLEEDPSRGFIVGVEQESAKRLRCVEINVKDIAIATMLSIYQYHCDNIKLAWRLIGTAARLSLELELHKLYDPEVDTAGPRHPHWVHQMFWCIYILDRRYSFMANLPFSIHDRDLNFKLLQQCKSTPYLVLMATFGRLGGKIIPAVPKFGYVHDELNDNTRTTLGHEIDLWAETASIDTFPGQTFESTVSNMRWTCPDHVRVFFRIRGNQLRLSLYKPTLYTPSKILKHPYFAQLAVQYAIDNIRTLSQSKVESEEVYQSHASHYKYFLVSSLVALYLAIRNAPQQFSRNSVEYLAGLQLLKCSSVSPLASENLSKTVLALENAMSGWNLARSNILANHLQFQWIPAPLPVLEAKSSSSESSKTVEHHEVNGRPQDNLLPSSPLSMLPLAATPNSQFLFNSQDWINTFPEQTFNKQNVFQDLANYDFDMEGLWNSPPENFLHDEATAETEIEGLI